MIRLQGVQKRAHHGKMINHTIRKESEDKLDQLLNDLEQKWDTMKQSKLKPVRRYSSIIVDEIFQLMDKSPRSIMSSLQQEWKVRNNDLAVVEIVRERRAAIESGKLKGRRLFNEPEGVTDEADSGDQRESLCIDSEVRSVCSYGSDQEEEGVGESELDVLLMPVSDSTDIAHQIEQVVEEGEKVVVAQVEEKTTSVAGGKWIVLVMLIVCALVVSMRSFFGYKDHKDDQVKTQFPLMMQTKKKYGKKP
ncbi:hypothetical protein Ddye_000926 [Dipteronia dyeriana]|uniref:Uncharacterized protein n=1 Tax=Dipteronia dyeriana TaxID=168575 RepID=A0AAE0CT03_9ROSI|nr:hypothetical protein Ddye_000926 [Dipteronia dyeriana]